MGTSGLGALLVEEGLLTEKDRRTIRRSCGHEGAAFAKSVVAIGLLTEDELAAFLAERTPHRIAAKDITTEAQMDAVGAIDRPLIERLEIVPLKLDGRNLSVAMADPLDQDTVRQLEFFSGYKILPVIATFTQIRTGLDKLMKGFSPRSSHMEDFLANHALSATRRLATIDAGADGKKKPKLKTAPTARTPAAQPAKAAPAPAPAPKNVAAPVKAAPSDEDDGLEYPGQDAAEEKEIPKVAAPVGVASAKTAPVVIEEDEVMGMGDIGDDLNAELDMLSEPEPPAPAASTGKDDLDALSAMDGIESLDDSELSDDLFGADDDLALESPDTGDATGDNGETTPDVVSEMLGETDLGETELSDDLFAADDTLDFELPPNDTMPIIAAINGALLKMTMSKDGKVAATHATAAFGSAGMRYGIIYTMEGDDAARSLMAFGGWSPAKTQDDQGVKDEPVYGDKDLDQFKSLGLAQALDRLGSAEGELAWHELAAGSRDLDLKPFTTWTTPQHALMAATVAGKTSGQKVAVVTAWTKKRAENEAVQASTLELLKQLGRKI